VGLYAYRREALLALSVTPASPLEVAENLEQLRALEHGMRVRVVLVPEHGRGVDTPEDPIAAELEWTRRERDRAALVPSGRESA
jgi:3-deoxy-manno-octulosonate cytidylyltransferase (CMP-KDO synthetase)